jgi:competence protein ComEC
MIANACGFVLGAWFLQQQALLPTALQTAWILGFTACLFVLVWRFSRRSFTAHLCVFVVAGLLGFVWAASLASLRLSDALPTEWQQKNITLVGVVASLPEVNERGVRFRFDVERVLTPDATRTLHVPRHLSLSDYYTAKSPQESPFHAGERWQLVVRLKRPHSTYNPHGFDFESWALSENIRATGSVNRKKGALKLQAFVWQPSYMIEAAREKIAMRISQALVNKPYAGVIRALVVGEDSQIARADWDVYLRTGTNHLMSISGLHITMLAGLAFSLTAFVWRRSARLVMLLPTRKAATIAGLLCALIYALLAGMSVPTQRTLIMLMTFSIALLLGRHIAILRVLALALFLVVAFDPWAVCAPGFWLSFGAVALIAYVVSHRLKPAHWLATAIHTQWAITLGLLPLLVMLFGQVSLVSPFANAFAIPIISLLVVPSAILGSMLPLDVVLQLAHAILAFCMHALNGLALIPTWQFAAPPMWAIVLAMLGVVWLLLPRGMPARCLGWAMLLPLLFSRPDSALRHGEMQVAVLDVGQGLSVVVKTAKHTFLYDAGPQLSSQSDAGSRIVVPYLRGQGIQHLDGMMVSHDDMDHSGGANAVLTQIPVTWFASSFKPPHQIKLPLTHFSCFAGQNWHWDGVDFAVLHPSVTSYQTGEIKDNNRSCVVKVTSQQGSVLLTGDIEQEAESALVGQQSPLLASDVLIAPHHGSKTSSTIDFVEAVHAQQVVFTNGYLNRFKHPKPLIENRYIENGAITYRSDYHGALVFDFMQNRAMAAQAWRMRQPRYWHDRY